MKRSKPDPAMMAMLVSQYLARKRRLDHDRALRRREKARRAPVMVPAAEIKRERRRQRNLKIEARKAG